MSERLSPWRPRPSEVSLQAMVRLTFWHARLMFLLLSSGRAPDDRKRAWHTAVSDAETGTYVLCFVRRRCRMQSQGFAWTKANMQLQVVPFCMQGGAQLVVLPCSNAAFPSAGKAETWSCASTTYL